jgi:hypothetical protein
MRYLLLAALLMIGLSASPASATDQNTFNKLIAKAAPPIGVLTTPGNFKPKLPCICTADLSLGFVAVDGTGHRAECWAPSFNPDGSLASESFCSGNDFIVLH